VLTGFMGATYWMVPDESRTELHSVKLAYIQLILWTLMGVSAVDRLPVPLWHRQQAA
jgi:nitric oxide reductase subunit B